MQHINASTSNMLCILKKHLTNSILINYNNNNWLENSSKLWSSPFYHTKYKKSTQKWYVHNNDTVITNTNTKSDTHIRFCFSTRSAFCL